MDMSCKNHDRHTQDHFTARSQRRRFKSGRSFGRRLASASAISALAAIAAADPPPCAVPVSPYGNTATTYSAAFPPSWLPHGPGNNGQDDWEWLNRSMGLGMTPWSGDGSPGVCGAKPSCCWRIDPRSLPQILEATRPNWGDTRGFPLNLDFYQIPATTNFPPLSQEAWASTAPFVSIPGDQVYRPQFLADRKIVAGVVDAITGQPLIREQDLELPVGQARFRLIRTYGGNSDGSSEAPWQETPIVGGQGARYALGKFWDWAGTGWMISENPILLFDAQYMQHEPTRPRTCYLILDAHHSIPFTQDPSTGQYAAPAWFDAILKTDGTQPPDTVTAPQLPRCGRARGPEAQAHLAG